ncbi:uncharacterized protein LOC116001487 [Ipomoea triloba]|uniref:uncharacterized protein LOC116001487 n=1 Tax=Ipomoea triloba TaxID=35885 RepID=UPI00125E4F9A|nr:uncharacterized protein LOC116001487 [Ipomoea triloba]
MIQTPQPSYLSAATVSGLLDLATNSWDDSILTDIFEPRDVNLIKRVPISPGYIDSWYWIDDIRGIYSVKSGYRRIRGSVTPLISGFDRWNNLLKLKIPPKWKTFIWRALTNTLPTTSNLIQRRLDIDPLCPLCASHVEDVSHVFLCCDFAVVTWHSAQFVVPSGAGLSFPLWFQQVLTTMDDDAVTRCTAILYAIWSARNSALWESKVPRPSTMVALADKALQNWRNSHITSSSHGLIYAPSPDAHSYNRCYIDAAYDPDSGRASVGAILLGLNGDFVAAIIL